MAAFMLFLIQGCGSSQDTGQTGNTGATSSTSQNSSQTQTEKTKSDNQYMPNPNIILGVYRSGFEDMPYIAAGTSVNAVGPVDYIDIVFESSIVSNNLSHLITLTGYKNLYFDSSQGLEIVRIGLGLDRGTKTTLKISKDITDAAGRCLKDDITLNINVLGEGARAQYKLVGTSGTYDLSKYTDESIEIPSGDKDFTVSFSKAVDKKSVVDSIGQGFSKQGISYSFKWQDDTNLKLHMAGLKPTNENNTGGMEYIINVEGAVDCDGKQVCSNLGFSAGKPNSIGYIDLSNKKPVVLHEFSDLLFMMYKNYSLDRYAVVHNPYMRELFDLSSGTVAGNFTDDQVQFDGQNTDWLDGNTLFAYDRQNNVLYKHTLDDGVRKEIKLPFAGPDEDFMMMRISPDGQKIAILYNWWQPSDLYIISIDGKLLCKYDDIASLRPLKSYEWVPGMAWLDNSHIAVEDGGYDENQNYDIVKLDIENGEKDTLIKNAIIPVTLPGKDTVLALKYDGYNTDPGEYVIVSGGRETGTIKINPDNSEEPKFLSNFLFTDNDHLVFNRNDDIVLYTISGKSEEVLGKGTIVGSTQDKSRIYYMTNYMGLYTYY